MQFLSSFPLKRKHTNDLKAKPLLTQALKPSNCLMQVLCKQLRVNQRIASYVTMASPGTRSNSSPKGTESSTRHCLELKFLHCLRKKASQRWSQSSVFQSRGWTAWLQFNPSSPHWLAKLFPNESSWNYRWNWVKKYKTVIPASQSTLAIRHLIINSLGTCTQRGQIYIFLMTRLGPRLHYFVFLLNIH